MGCCGRRNLWRMAQALCHKFWKSDVGGTCACSWLVRCRSALLSAITRTGAIKTVRELVAFLARATGGPGTPQISPRTASVWSTMRVAHSWSGLRSSCAVRWLSQKHKAQERSVRDWLKVASMLCLRSMETLDSALSKVEISNRRSSLNWVERVLRDELRASRSSRSGTTVADQQREEEP